jgi:predicted glycoside hydrolase/deacetylase ChbG (UPF0249 family)
MNAFTALVEPLGVPLRGDGRVPYVGGFYAEGGELERVGPAQLLESVRAHVRADLVELGCHPGRVTGELVSSYAEPREVELATLTEPQLRRELEDAGFELVSFADVSKEVRAR